MTAGEEPAKHTDQTTNCSRQKRRGPRALIENGSVNSKSTTIWNGEVGYRLSNKARLVLEAFNIFDANVSDIDYFYASRFARLVVNGVIRHGGL